MGADPARRDPGGADDAAILAGWRRDALLPEAVDPSILVPELMAPARPDPVAFVRRPGRRPAQRDLPLRLVFRRLVGGSDPGKEALVGHLGFAYQRVLLLQRVCQAARRSRGTTAERMAYVCSTARCGFDDAAWAVCREDAAKPATAWMPRSGKCARKGFRFRAPRRKRARSRSFAASPGIAASRAPFASCRVADRGRHAAPRRSSHRRRLTDVVTAAPVRAAQTKFRIRVLVSRFTPPFQIRRLHENRRFRKLSTARRRCAIYGRNQMRGRSIALPPLR